MDKNDHEVLYFEIIYQILECLREHGPQVADDLLTKVSNAQIFENVPLTVDVMQIMLATTKKADLTKVVEFPDQPRIDLTKDGIKTYYINKKHREKARRKAYQQANPITFQLTPAKGYEERSEVFVDKYDLINVFIPIETPQPKPKDETEKVCRFCKKKHPEVRFTQYPHLIPDMLGHNSWYSDFECDDCNYFFGTTYENDLANYLGISRTLTQTRGKEKVPSFTSPGDVIKAKYQKFQNEPSVLISRGDTNNDAIKADIGKGQILLKVKRNPFTPLKVYKAFLKIALSVLPENVMPQYEFALELLLAKKKSLDKGFVMNGYSLPFSYNLPPHVFLFEKREKNAHIPTHIAAIYFSNSIFAIPIPLHKKDMKKFQRNPQISMPLYPALFTQFTNVVDIPIVPFQEDFSSEDVVCDSYQEIIMQIAKEELDKIAVFNKTTGEVKLSTFNPAEITRIMISNTPINSFSLNRIE